MNHYTTYKGEVRLPGKFLTDDEMVLKFAREQVIKTPQMNIGLLIDRLLTHPYIPPELSLESLEVFLRSGIPIKAR